MAAPVETAQSMVAARKQRCFAREPADVGRSPGWLPPEPAFSPGTHTSEELSTTTKLASRRSAEMLLVTCSRFVEILLVALRSGIVYI